MALQKLLSRERISKVIAGTLLLTVFQAAGVLAPMSEMATAAPAADRQSADVGYRNPGPNSGDVPIEAGAYIIDSGALSAGATKQTVNQGLKQYGLVYELVKAKVPVQWIINASKANVDVVNGNAGTDFSFDCMSTGTPKNYKSGAFVIPKEFAAQAKAIVDRWKSSWSGLTVDGPCTNSYTNAATNNTVPLFATIKSWPRSVLDAQNGSVAVTYFNNAGIPQGSLTDVNNPPAYRFASPSQLTPCDDMYIMPHADPTYATHSGLISFVKNGGDFYASCHAVSVIENMKDGSGKLVTNFLSETGTIMYNAHTSQGSPAYSLGAGGVPGDPVAQWLGTTDAAMQAGSEQIFIPSTTAGTVSRWRPTTRVLVYDQTQANVNSGAAVTNPNQAAAAILYGPAYGDINAGLVMYQGGHSVAKGTVDDVAAQRAFFNFQLLAAVNNGKVPTAADRTPTVVMTETATAAASTGSSFPVAGYAMGGSGTYRYSWASQCSDTNGPISATGSFASTSSSATTFTAPNVPGAIKCNLTLTIVDSCGRFSFGYQTIAIAPTANIRISQTVSPSGSALTGAILRYTAVITNDGAIAGTTSGDGNYASDVMVTIPVPTGGTFNSAYKPTWTYSGTSPAGVSFDHDDINNKVIFYLKTLGDEQSVTITYELTPGEPGAFKVVATAGTTSFDTDLTDNSATNSTSVIADTSPKPSLTLEKTPTDQVAASGGSAAFKLRIRNSSNTSQSIKNITIKDTFAPTAARLSCTDGSGTFWAAVTSGSTYVISEIKYQEAWEAACSLTGITTSGTNTLSINSATADSGTVTSNSSTASFATPGDLVISKSGPSVLNKGLDATYTITITNKGTAKTGIKISDLLPAGLSVDSATVEASNLASNDTATPTVIAWDKFETDSSGSGWKSGSTWTYSGGSRISATTSSLSSPAKYENFAARLGGNTPSAGYNMNRVVRLSNIYKSATLHFECLTDDTRTATSDINAKPNVIVSVGSIVVGTKACGTSSRIEQAIVLDLSKLSLTSSLQDFQIKFQMGGTWTGTKYVWIDDVFLISGEVSSDQFSDISASSWTKSSSSSSSSWSSGSSTSYLKGYTTGSATFPGSSTYADGSFQGFSLTSDQDSSKSASITKSISFDASLYSNSGVSVIFACTAYISDSNSSLKIYLGGQSSSALSITKDNKTSYCGTDSNSSSSNMRVVTLTYPSSLITAGRVNTLNVKFTFSSKKKNDKMYLDDFFVVGKELGSVQSKQEVSWKDALNGPGGNGYSLASNATIKLTFNAHVAQRIPESYLAGLVNIAGVTSSIQSTPTYATVFTPFKATSISLSKTVNKKSVLSGDTVTATYVIGNPGNDTLTAVTLTDPDCGSFSARVVLSGNNDTSLQPGERWKYTCIITVNSAKTGLASASGTNTSGNPEVAEARDDVSVATASMSVSVSPAVKKIYPNSTVTYTYTVLNTGNVELYKAGLTIQDCTTPRFKSGDDNGDGNIDPEETWVFLCTTSPISTSLSGRTVVATATAVDFESAVTSNTANYSVEIVQKPKLYISKSSRDSVSNTGPASSITVADSNTVTYRYTVTLDSTTATSVSSVRVSDTGCNVPSTPISGDTNSNAIFETSETWVFECTAPKLSISETSTASASGLDGLGNRVQSDEVENYVEVVAPEILLTINPNKDYVLYGENVTYTYKVKNTGGVPFSQITPSDTNCAGLSTRNSVLGLGETWTFTCIRAADTSTLLSEFNVSATYNTSLTYQPPQANYTVFIMDPRMTIVKLAQVYVGSTNETRTVFSSSVSAGRGDKIVFKYRVTPNEGPKAAPIPGINALILNAISDNDCDIPTFKSLKDASGFNIGDINGSGAMDKGEVWEYTCTAKASVTSNVRGNGEVILSPAQMEAIPASEATSAGPGASIRKKEAIKHFFTATAIATIQIAEQPSEKFTVRKATEALRPKVLYVTDTSSATVTIDGSLVNHALSYSANGGSGIAPDTQYGSGVMTLATNSSLSRSGFTFAGWSETATTLAASARTEGSSFTLGAVDVVMYAIWYATVTYVHNGEDSGATQIVDSNKYLPLGTVTTNAGAGFTRAGATFSGWNTAADGSGTTYAANSTFSISGDTTLYARWMTSLSYNGNGNSSGTYPAALTSYPLGTQVTVPGNTGNYVKGTSKFLGWQDANGVDYFQKDILTLDTFTVLTAQWTDSPTVLVLYNSDSATSGSVPTDTRNYLPGDEVTLESNSGNLQKTGYTFGGWILNSVNYQSGDKYVITTNATFTAIWNPDGSSGSGSGGNSGGNSSGGGSVTILPKVTFNPNYAGPSPTFQSGNGTVTLLPNTFKRPGFIFKGWSRTTAGPVQILDGGTLELTGDLTLYAIWEAEPVTPSPSGPVTVTFNSNCSPVVTDKQSNAGKVKLNSNTFSCAGSAFAGWSTSPTGSVEYIDQAFFNFTKATTLYAVWNKNVVAPVITKGELRFEVFFPLNSVIISQAEKKNIVAQVAAIKKKAGPQATIKVSVEGWVQPTVKTGNIEFLSKYRAKHVADMMKNLGLKATYKEFYKGLGVDNLPKMRHASVIVTWSKSK